MITIATLLLFINQVRAKPLTLDKDLTRIAQTRCVAMKEWSHIGFPKEQIWSQGYRYVGENLARNFQTSELLFNAFQNSPSHKANNESLNYQRIGIGLCTNKIGNVVVLEFAGK